MGSENQTYTRRGGRGRLQQRGGRLTSTKRAMSVGLFTSITIVCGRLRTAKEPYFRASSCGSICCMNMDGISSSSPSGAPVGVATSLSHIHTPTVRVYR